MRTPFLARSAHVGYPIHCSACRRAGADAIQLHELLPAGHRVASLCKLRLVGTPQGGVHPERLQAYDEFCFRLNRRRTRAQDPFFYGLCSIGAGTPSDLLGRWWQPRDQRPSNRPGSRAAHVPSRVPSRCRPRIDLGALLAAWSDLQLATCAPGREMDSPGAQVQANLHGEAQ